MTDETPKLGGCSLPGDVMVDILQCLPVKSLLRFRAVSKSWYVFISSRDFVHIHLRHPHHEKLLRVSDKGPRSTPTISFFSLDHTSPSHHDDDKVELFTGNDDDGNDLSAVIDFPFPSSPEDEVRVVGSGNGLLCVHFARSSSIVLWNPATKMYKFLILPDCVSFYCDPFFPYIMLGYVPETEDYKIVKVPSVRKDAGDAWVWVYTLSSDSWEEIGPVLRDLFPKGGPSVTLNAYLYWMSSCKSNGLDVLTSFDLYNQVFGEIRLPNSDIPNCTIRKLVVLKGCVSMITYSGSDVDVEHYEVWVMTEPESWTKQFDFPSFSELARPVGSWKDGKLLFGYPNGMSHELLSYNPFTKRVQSFRRRSSLGGFKVINYVESLESVESS